MKILLINWQDWTNPMSGGAEIHLREIFRRIVEAGHSVDLLCSSYPSAPREEVIDGIRILRRGNRHNFNFAAMFSLWTEFKGSGYDLLVEDINKIPVYSPLFIRLPHLVIAPHLFGTTVFNEVAWPLATYVYTWELPMKTAYRKSRFEVISKSTKEDLVDRGIAPERIEVIYCGLDHDTYTISPDSHPHEPPYILFLGRVKRYKRIDLVLRAFKKVREEVERVHLIIAGDGDYLSSLKRQARNLRLESAISFVGHSTEEEKVRLYQEASLLMNTSEKEGWGLTNVEAQGCGCPVVATNSPGLRESLVHGKTGFLVHDRDENDLARKAIEILKDPLLRSRLSEEGRRWVKRFDWEVTAAQTLALIERLMTEHAGYQ
jgi:glycosyltransferase involved in cell wall biosynthesis